MSTLFKFCWSLFKFLYRKINGELPWGAPKASAAEKTCPRPSRSRAEHFQKLREWLKFSEKTSQTFQSDDSNFQWALTQCDEKILVFRCSPGGSQGSWLLRSWSMLNECKIKCQLNSRSQCATELLFISASHLPNSVLFFFSLSLQKTSVSPSVVTDSGETSSGFEKNKQLSAAAPSGNKQRAMSDKQQRHQGTTCLFSFPEHERICSTYFSFTVESHCDWIDKHAGPQLITGFILTAFLNGAAKLSIKYANRYVSWQVEFSVNR